MARVITSPTTLPMLPPTNFSSMAQMWTATPVQFAGRRNDGVPQMGSFLRRG